MIGVVRLWREIACLFDTVCHELQSLNRSGVEQRTVISENAVVADPDIAMIDRAAFVCRTERGVMLMRASPQPDPPLFEAEVPQFSKRLSWISMSHTAPDSNQ